MDIILDTNVFVQDMHMVGGQFLVLLDGLHRTDARLVIPSVVQTELLAKYREKMSELSLQFQKCEREYHRFTNQKLKLPELDVNALCRSYASFVRQHLYLSGATVYPDWPSVSHERIATRIAQRRKPSRNGNGYRDVLIWESIVAHMQQAKLPAAFVTQNTKDFCDNGKLHPELIADFEKVGIAPAQLRFFETLKELNAEVFEPTLLKLDEIKEQMQRGDYPLDLRSCVLSTVGDANQLDSEMLAAVVIDGHSDDVDSACIKAITVKQVAALPENQMLVDLVAEVKADIRVHPKDGYYHPRHGVINGAEKHDAEFTVGVSVLVQGVSSVLMNELTYVKGAYGEVDFG